eukprot:4420718-Pyramimonas_sp.AAC.1
MVPSSDRWPLANAVSKTMATPRSSGSSARDAALDERASLRARARGAALIQRPQCQGRRFHVEDSENFKVPLRARLWGRRREF